jgi:hypothetical protein
LLGCGVLLSATQIIRLAYILSMMAMFGIALLSVWWALGLPIVPVNPVLVVLSILLQNIWGKHSPDQSSGQEPFLVVCIIISGLKNESVVLHSLCRT